MTLTPARMSEWRRRNPEQATAAARRWETRRGKRCRSRGRQGSHTPPTFFGTHEHSCVRCKGPYTCSNACDPVSEGLKNSICNPCLVEVS